MQVFAKKPGVTQINLWNEQNEIHTIDVMVFGDARELAMLIRTEFPHATIRVKPLAQSVVLSGFVDRQDHVSQIIRMAEDYYPKVISHITVGGVQQISLERQGVRSFAHAAANVGHGLVDQQRRRLSRLQRQRPDRRGFGGRPRTGHRHAGDTIRFGVDGRRYDVLRVH